MTVFLGILKYASAVSTLWNAVNLYKTASVNSLLRQISGNVTKLPLGHFSVCE